MTQHLAAFVENSGGAHIRFEATVPAAAAAAASRIDHHMSKLAGRSMRAEEELSIEAQTPANAGPERQTNQMSAAPFPPEAPLAKRHHVHIIVNETPARQPPFKRSCERHIAPSRHVHKNINYHALTGVVVSIHAFGESHRSHGLTPVALSCC